MPAEPSSPPSWCTGYPSDLRPREGPGWSPVLPQSVALPDWDLQMNAWQLCRHKVHLGWSHVSAMPGWAGSRPGTSHPHLVFSPQWPWRRARPVPPPQTASPKPAETLRWWTQSASTWSHLHKRKQKSQSSIQHANIFIWMQPVRANQSMRLKPKGLAMKMRHQMPETLQIAKPMTSTTRSATRRLSQRTNRKPAITSMPQRQYMMLFSSSPYPKNFWVSGVTIVWRGDNSPEPLTDGVRDIRRDGYISASRLNLQCRLIEECDELGSQKHDHLLSQELYRQSDTLGLILNSEKCKIMRPRGCRPPTSRWEETRTGRCIGDLWLWGGRGGVIQRCV